MAYIIAKIYEATEKHIEVTFPFYRKTDYADCYDGGPTDRYQRFWRTTEHWTVKVEIISRDGIVSIAELTVNPSDFDFYDNDLSEHLGLGKYACSPTEFAEAYAIASEFIGVNLD